MADIGLDFISNFKGKNINHLWFDSCSKDKVVNAVYLDFGGPNIVYVAYRRWGNLGNSGFYTGVLTEKELVNFFVEESILSNSILENILAIEQKAELVTNKGKLVLWYKEPNLFAAVEPK
ncbi:hypothetical protein [Hahella sp. CCB-MM4]|uniref:hypothetical protein n=1 Tax=Hahella sp. (strain CCB-MM4) TaxID=1926491 RepID=UPI000B9BF184|nr:hypothetical protein [Hahella sp. CCB-MM4]